MLLPRDSDGDQDTQQRERPEVRKPERVAECDQRDQLRAPDREQVVAAEHDRGRFDTNSQVVVPVDHRVERVVGQCPGDVTQEQGPDDSVERLVVGGKRHRYRHRKREPEPDLRPERDPLEPRIDHSKTKRDKRQLDCFHVGHKDQPEAHRKEHDRKDYPVLYRQVTARDWSRSGSLDVPVELTVGQVVDDAPSAPGDNHAEREDHPDV